MQENTSYLVELTQELSLIMGQIVSYIVGLWLVLMLIQVGLTYLLFRFWFGR